MGWVKRARILRDPTPSGTPACGCKPLRTKAFLLYCPVGRQHNELPMIYQPFGRLSDLILALIVLAVSWLLLRLERKGLDALGLDQPVRRLREFITAFAVMVIALVLVDLLSTFLAGVSWQWNRNFILGDFFIYLVYPILAKVLVVALVFQGYLLLQQLRFAGPTLGLYSAAVIFGLYDVFALHAEGNISRAVPVFLSSGVYGFVLALAFRQTGSLAAPMGLNLGWHFMGKAVFGSSMPTFQMFVLPDDATLNKTGSYGGVLGLGVIAAALGLYSWWLLRKYPDKGNMDRGFKTVRTEG